MAKLDFSRLSATQFEEFAFDLMGRLGFGNVDWRKGTPRASSPADSGRDIVCQQFREDVDKSKHVETWFVDCKHYKRAVPPTELENLLTWAQAERPHTALFVVSGFLSNGAKDYLEKYHRNNRPPFRIKYWERPKLEQLCNNKRALLMDHGLLSARTRSVTAILKAEEEFLERIWYDRKLVLLANIKEGRRPKIPPDIQKGMLEGMRRVERKYGGKKALREYYKSDFEWGMINGKLSALRWVLGDEWDMLDT